jgi:protease IV
VANGGVFTGRLALESGLIDAIGGEAEAIDWLESQNAELGELPVRDWAVQADRTILGSIVGRIMPTGGILGEISRIAGPKLYSLGP